MSIRNREKRKRRRRSRRTGSRRERGGGGCSEAEREVREMWRQGVKERVSEGERE